MSDAATPAADNPLMQMMQANLPETVQDLRNLLNGFAQMMNAGLPEVGAFHEGVPVEGAGDGVTADIVVPEGEGPFPVLVYLHGGGWVAGSPKSHQKVGYRFAEKGYLVFNVDYRMAPEHPFPTSFEDCVAAIRFAAKAASQYGGDGTRLAIGGDSAGGNLSAAAAIALADDPDVRISAALLIYGVFDFARIGDTSGIVAADPALAEAGSKLVEMMVGSYLGDDRSDARLQDPRISPVHGAAKLPPSHIVCGAADPLAAQAEALADVLAEAGVEHEKFIVDAMPHGYVQMEFFPQARESIDRMVAFLDARVKA